jgi:predicted nucleic acid-binding protein
MLHITNLANDHDLYTAGITGPEIIAALTRRLRGSNIPPQDGAQTLATFRLDWQQRYSSITIRESILDTAMDLAERYRLRGADAIHLACAVVVNVVVQSHGQPPLIFISADREQLTAATAEGLVTDDPNQHP